MFYLDSKRTITRRDSSLISRRTNLSNYSDNYLDLTPELPSEPKARGSVQREITSLFFESMLTCIVDSWEVLEIKEKKKKKGEETNIQKKHDKGMHRKSKSVIGTPSQIFITQPIEKGWWSVPDERVVIHFKNGNVYEGDISAKCMHGEGRFQWADGTIYFGQFKENQIKGRGTIEWKDHTWYTGEFEGNLRHGHGLFVDSRRQRSYSGSWYCGTKHGLGNMYYSGDFQNSYKGEWDRNLIHGNGLREYCNQSAYSGDFEYFTRDGMGEMISSDHCFYKGSWKNGLVNGNGFYIWNCFRNETMSAPLIVSYYGTWFKGMRDGYGILYTGPGLVSRIKGQFKNDQKHGGGILITEDGLIVTAKPLFVDDVYHPENPTYTIPAKRRLKKSLSEKTTLLCDNTRAFKYHIANAIRNHTEYERIARVCLLNDFLDNNGLQERFTELDKRSQLINEDFFDFEDRCLRLAVIQYREHITNIYRNYSKICNTEPIYFSAALIRLYFWQFCHDCNFYDKNINLTEIDNLLSRNKTLNVHDSHNPFERLHWWQFAHALITLACHFYVGKTIPGHKPDTMVASAFCHFMETDVLPNVGSCKGKLVKNTFVPIPALYALYLSLDEPRTVRKFLCATRISPHLYMEHPQPPLINAEEEHVPRGKNCYLFGEKMIFVEEKDLLFEKEKPVYDIPKNLQLFNFGNLSSKFVIEQFANIIPKLLENDKIMNIEVEITFYEFFEVFIACAEESIRVKDEELKWRALYTRTPEPPEHIIIPEPVIKK